MSHVAYHYLTQVDPSTNSNKFWCIVKAGSTWLRGYGRRGNHGGVTWTEIDDLKALATLRSKRKSGYTDASIAEMNPATFAALVNAYEKRRPNETIVIDQATGNLTSATKSGTSPTHQPTRRPAAPTSSSRRAHQMLKNWF